MTTTAKTTKTTTTLQDQIAQHEAAADAARAKARDLQQQADQAAEARAREEAAALDADMARRRENYHADYVAPLDGYRAAFDEAVTTGGNYAGAWITYTAHAQRAANERAAIEHHRHRKESNHYGAIADLINAYNVELAATANKELPMCRALTADQDNDGANHEWLRELFDGDEIEDENRVEQINRRLNTIAEELGATEAGRRDPDSMEWVHVVQYAETPRGVSMRAGESSETRTFAQAVEQAITAAVEAEVRKLAKG